MPILPELLREEEAQHDKGAGIINGYNMTLANSTAAAVVAAATAKEATLSLVSMDEHNHQTNNNANLDESCLKQLFHLRMLNENSQLGILFSTKVKRKTNNFPYFSTLIIFFLSETAASESFTLRRRQLIRRAEMFRMTFH